MRDQGGSTLLRLLLVLAALCYTGFSLKCYECFENPPKCNATKLCASGLDSCLVAKSGEKMYHQCWKYAECNTPTLKARLGVIQISYRCCLTELCNEKLNDGTAALSGKTVLLVIPFVATVWSLCF